MSGRGAAFSMCPSSSEDGMPDASTILGSADDKLAWRRATTADLRKLVLTVAIAAAVASCAGPVDHSCHTNPQDSQGSGCEHHRFGGPGRA